MGGNPAASGKVFHNMGTLNGMSPNDSPGTTLPIYQALLQGMVTTPLDNRSEDSVIVSCCMSSLHPFLKNVTTPAGQC